MAFGQSSGPPASHKQLEELVGSVEALGFDDLKQARHRLGLTQRQAGGKFTRDEADTLIAELASMLESGEGAPEAPADSISQAPRRKTAPVASRVREDSADLSHISAQALATELQARGWVVMEP